MRNILPFNAPATARATMYERRLPEVLWMPVVLYHLPGASPAGLDAIARQLQLYLVQMALLTHKNPGFKGPCIVPMVHEIEMPDCVISALHPLQRQWMIGPVYPQAGYYDEPGVQGIVRSVACAMTIGDTCSCLSGILHPDQHAPLKASLTDAEEYERTVANHYRSGIGVWSEHLVNHRNQILIRNRAIMSGMDTDIAWKQFQMSGKQSFLL